MDFLNTFKRTVMEVFCGIWKTTDKCWISPTCPNSWEKVVHAWMLAHVDAIGTMPRMQSAYRRYHSTKTAILRIFNDVAVAIDSGSTTAEWLLDLSGVFDTEDHGLLGRLEKMYGCSGSTLKWLGTYLVKRSFQVHFANQQSSSVQLKCRVPQGPVIGSLLFIIYNGATRWHGCSTRL